MKATCGVLVIVALAFGLAGCPAFEALEPAEQLAVLQATDLTPAQQYEVLRMVHGSNCPPFAQCPPEDPHCGGPASWTPLFFLMEDPEGDQVVILTPIYRLIHEWTCVEMDGRLPCEVNLILVAEDIPTL